MHDDDAAQKLVAHLREMQVHDEPVFDKPAWLEQHEPAMRTKLEALDVNQREIDKLLVAFLQERQDLEMKYEGLLGPHYKARMDIVTGDSVAQCSSSIKPGIPGFWLKVLQAHPEIQDRISDKDAMVLQHLVGVTALRSYPGRDGADTCGFALKFCFSPNDFFGEEELALEVTFADEDESVVQSIEGSTISWSSPGKNPTVKVKKKGGVKEHRRVKLEAADSFFKLFDSIQPPTEGAIDVHEYEALKQEAEECLAIAMILMEDMIPNAFKYFSGEKTFEADFDDSNTDSDEEEERIGDSESDKAVSRFYDDTQVSKVDNDDVPPSQHDCKQQ